MLVFLITFSITVSWTLLLVCWIHDSDPTNNGVGEDGDVGDEGVELDFSLLSGRSEPRLLPTEDRVNLRTFSRNDGYKDLTELWDQSMRGLTFCKTDRRNRMYTHGSRIWFQVAKRIQRSRYFTVYPVPAKAVVTMKT